MKDIDVFSVVWIIPEVEVHDNNDSWQVPDTIYTTIIIEYTYDILVSCTAHLVLLVYQYTTTVVRVEYGCKCLHTHIIDLHSFHYSRQYHDDAAYDTPDDSVP